MSKNVNVFIGVLLCAVLCGTFVWLSSSGDESSWSPNDIYNEVQGTGSVGGYATTSATFSGPSNDGGVALPMSSSSMRARTSYKYAGAYSGATPSPIAYSQSPIANSLTASSPLTYGAASGAGLHLTSNAEIKSFGGGGNGGASMSYSQSSISNLQSPIANSQSPIANLKSPIAYSTVRRGGMSSVAGDDLAMLAAENPVMAAASAANAANAGMNTSFYGGMYTTADYSSADYGQYSGMFGGGSRMGVRGRQGTTTFDDAWTNWLLGWLQENGYTSADFNGNGIIDDDELAAIYAALQEDSNTGMGMLPTEDDIRDFLTASLPVGDIAPLLLIALLYVLFVAIKSNALKSLIKTERSE